MCVCGLQLRWLILRVGFEVNVESCKDEITAVYLPVGDPRSRVSPPLSLTSFHLLPELCYSIMSLLSVTITATSDSRLLDLERSPTRLFFPPLCVSPTDANTHRCVREAWSSTATGAGHFPGAPTDGDPQLDLTSLVSMETESGDEEGAEENIVYL